MVTFTALAKIYSTKIYNISAIQRYLGLVKFLSSKNFHIYSKLEVSVDMQACISLYKEQQKNSSILSNLQCIDSIPCYTETVMLKKKKNQ